VTMMSSVSRMLVGLIVLVACSMAAAPGGAAAMTGRIVVAGYGPELPVIQELGKAFEKANPGTAIDVEWEKNLKAIDLVKSGRAQIAVTDHDDPALKSAPIAWDGIAVIVNFSNPVKEVTKEQIRNLFTGKIKRWSELDGADAKVELLQRPPDGNISIGFEQSLGITGQVSTSAKVIRSDQKTLSEVSGKDAAITYVSLDIALKAQEDGIPIQVLVVDRVEAAEPTVKDGRYTIRRPVLLLTEKQPNELAEAFVAFAVSPEGQRIIKMMFVPYSPPSKDTKRT
jgi:phosphate transport system substrate-binding protein